MANSFGLGMPSSGQNIYKNLNAVVYNVWFVSVSWDCNLKSYSPL